MTTMRSADLTVERRWAIRMLVVALKDQVERCWICPLGEGSMLAVASSRMKTAVLHQHAHQRDELALAHRKARAAFAHLAVQPVGSASSHSPPPICPRDAFQFPRG